MINIDTVANALNSKLAKKVLVYATPIVVMAVKEVFKSSKPSSGFWQTSSREGSAPQAEAEVHPSLEPIKEVILEKAKEIFEKIKPDLIKAVSAAFDSLLGEMEKGLMCAVKKVTSFFSSNLGFA